jgi:heat shock protein HslJ
MKLILILFSLIAIKTCENSDESENHQMNLEGNYSIETVSESDVNVHQLTIQFNNETKQVSGFSGCNRFFGSYTLEGNILNIGPLASTKMMCQDPANTIESQLLNQLSNINSFSTKDKTLILKANDDAVITATLKEEKIE